MDFTNYELRLDTRTAAAIFGEASTCNGDTDGLIAQLEAARRTRPTGSVDRRRNKARWSGG